MAPMENTRHMTHTVPHTMTRTELCALWQRWFKRAPPVKISQPVLRRLLGFEAQARKQGGLDRKTKAAIVRLQKEMQTGAQPCPGPPGLQPGARLLREWNGVTHIVDVGGDGGFIWKGQTYRSLSAIARAITGAHWSGPRFFGLREGERKVAGAIPNQRQAEKKGAKEVRAVGKGAEVNPEVSPEVTHG